MSKSSKTRRAKKTKVSLDLIVEFQRRLDALQISLAKVWAEGFDDGHAQGYAEGTGTWVEGDVPNPYKVEKAADPVHQIRTKGETDVNVRDRPL